jgi:hypothetical protein
MVRSSVWILVVSALLVLCAELPVHADEVRPIDLDLLRQTGEDWLVVAEDLGIGQGFVRVHHDLWFMHFLHWRPLPKAAEAPSVASVRELMSSFWGPSMQFEFTGNDGAVTVAGHPAVFVEGTLSDRAIRTRFVVWDCPESGRRFIADENINEAAGTPMRLLELQREITLSTVCHGREAEDTAGSWRRWPELAVALSAPESVRSRIFPFVRWYPDGPTRSRGSVWTLPTDSEQLVELRWQPGDGPVSKSELEELLDSVGAGPGSSIDHDSLTVAVTERTEGGLTASGAFDVVSVHGEHSVRNPFLFRAFLWHDGETAKLLVASMLCQHQIWGIDNDLTPSEATVHRFVSERLWPATERFRRSSRGSGEWAAGDRK